MKSSISRHSFTILIALPLLAVLSQLTLADENSISTEKILLPPLLLKRTNESFYPASALRRGAQGLVFLSFRIARNGHSTDAKVIHSSGDKDLDDAALRHLKNFTYSVPLEWESRNLVEHEFRIVVEFIVDCADVPGSVKSLHQESDSEWTDGWTTITAERRSCVPR